MSDDNVSTTSSKKYSAVIFDMDGVLTETSHQHFEAWQALANRLGYHLPSSVLDAVRGISRNDSLEIVLKVGNINDKFNPCEKQALADLKNKLYVSSIKTFNQENLSEGVLDLLVYLKQNGIKIALASASNNAVQLLENMKIIDYFDAVVDPKSVTNGKPAPDLFLKAAELLGVPPFTCIGVEDAYAGIESIKSAGMLPLGIGNKAVLTNCNLVFSNLTELHAYLKIAKILLKGDKGTEILSPRF